MIKKENNKQEKVKQKNKRDIGRIATRIIAAVLAFLMVVAFATTAIYYLINM